MDLGRLIRSSDGDNEHTKLNAPNLRDQLSVLQCQRPLDRFPSRGMFQWFVQEKRRLKKHFLAQIPMNFEDNGVDECLRISEYDIGSAEGPTGCEGTQVVFRGKHAPHHRIIEAGEHVQSQVDTYENFHAR